MRIIIEIGVFFMNLIYCFHKLAPVKNRITFISRQSNDVSVDARMLFAALNEEYPDIETRTMCRMIPSGIAGKIGYVFHMIGPQMHALATSRVIILEGYIIPVSILRHKKRTKVLQMWHALGIFKRFGKMVEGSEEGYNKTVIEGMRMHKNYDVILTSSEFCRPFYAEAFGYPLDKIIVNPLPRVDLLRDEEYHREKAGEIYSIYPELKDKKVILYAPTHRNGESLHQAVDSLIAAGKEKGFSIIVKLHPIDMDSYQNSDAYYCSEFTSFELLSVADYVVTDYSAFVFEAVCSKRPVFFFAYDMEDYNKNRGLCIDYEKEMPTKPQKDPDTLMDMIVENKYDEKRIADFSAKFIDQGTHCTGKLVELTAILYNN